MSNIADSQEQRVAKVREVAKRAIAPAVYQVLTETVATLPPHPARQKNLAALSSTGAAVVVTGQQLGLFLGPLLTLYKALSAIADAKALQEESGIPVVPIFWLQNEDHDYEEIRSTSVLTREGQLHTIALPPEEPDEQHISLAARHLPQEITQLHDDLSTVFRSYPSAETFLSLLKRHYVSGASYTTAFAGALAELTAEDGLLFFDPRHPLLSSQLVPLFESCLKNHREITEALLQQSQRIEKEGQAAQVHVRAGSPLFFFHPHSASGPRYRIEQDGDAWKYVGAEGTIATEKLYSLLQTEPNRFSTSALLRPIVQDTLLPVAAYVGGPAEQRYLRQIVPLYALFNATPSLIIPRAMFRLIDEKNAAWLSEHGLTPEDLVMSDSDLVERLAGATVAPSPAGLFDSFRATLLTSFLPLEQAVSALDQTLATPLEKTKQNMEHALSVFSDRYAKAYSRQDQTTLERIAKLRMLLFPGGVDQERALNACTFFCRYGDDALQQLRNRIVPFEPQVKNVVLTFGDA